MRINILDSPTYVYTIPMYCFQCTMVSDTLSFSEFKVHFQNHFIFKLMQWLPYKHELVHQSLIVISEELKALDTFQNNKPPVIFC